MNRSLLIILAVIIFIAALIPVFFKIDEVPDVDWRATYDLRSKEPNGLWVMAEMLRNRYGDENVITDPSFNALNYEDDEDHLLYLAIGNELNYDYHQALVLEEFIQYTNNSVMLIANNITFDGNIVTVESNGFPDLLDTIQISYPEDLSATETFEHYQGSLKQSSSLAIRSIALLASNPDDEDNLKPLVMVRDFGNAAERLTLPEGSFTIHSCPSMFVNVAARQEFYLSHLNNVMNGIEAEKIILTLPSGSGLTGESPISVLLRNKSLKAAYYFLLFTLATLLFFSTKRKKALIKTHNSPPNTSLQSAHSIARMHQVFGTNEGFVDVMERNFYRRIKTIFGVSETDPNFSAKMAKKSWVDAEMMADIIRSFKKMKKKCSDQQLIALRNKIVKFNKKSQHG